MYGGKFQSCWNLYDPIVRILRWWQLRYVTSTIIIHKHNISACSPKLWVVENKPSYTTDGSSKYTAPFFIKQKKTKTCTAAVAGTPCCTDTHLWCRSIWKFIVLCTFFPYLILFYWIQKCIVITTDKKNEEYPKWQMLPELTYSNMTCSTN